MELRRFGTEAAFRDVARAEGFGEPYGWSNGPGDTYAPHQHPYQKLLVCSVGSITFHVGPEAEPMALEAGDGFLLPAGTSHSAAVGPDGCTCLEAHRPEGG